MTKFREIVTAEYAKAKQLSAQRKQVKDKLNEAYAEYKKFMAETYKPGRKAVFEAIAKAKADRKADKTAKKAAASVKKTPAKEVVKAVAPAIKKAEAKKSVAKKDTVKKDVPAAK